jgi:hypothetical protein
MAQNSVAVADMIVPQVFTGMAIERTREKTAFIGSGILQDSGVLNAWLQGTIGNGGGGQTLRRPTWNDLASGDTLALGRERTSTDGESPLYTAGFGTAFPPPQDLNTHEEIAVFVDRNNHWSATQMAGIISGAKGNVDPISVIGDLVGAYWARRLQKMVLATVAGVLADNSAAPTGTEHVQNDLTFDVSGGGFVAGVTNFTAESLYDTLQTMGDADNVITNIAVHSAVRNRMRKNNLIDIVRDSDGVFQFEAFQGLRLTVDDGMPNPSTGIYHSYLFGPGFLEYGAVAPENATTTVWRDEAGNGSGSKELWNRVRWSVHPMGHKYVAASIPAYGGPENGDASTVNTLAHAASWARSAQSRKHIPFARLITRES